MSAHADGERNRAFGQALGRGMARVSGGLLLVLAGVGVFCGLIRSGAHVEAIWWFCIWTAAWIWYWRK